MSDQFTECVINQLREAGFGKKRSDDMLKRFDGLREGYKFEGMADAAASAKAQERLFDELRNAKLDKLRGKIVQAEQFADGARRMDEAFRSEKKATHWAWDGGTTRGAYLARAIISKWVDDPRFTGNSYTAVFRQTMEDLFSQLNEGLQKYGKGIFGRQKGMADQLDFVNAFYGKMDGTPDAVSYARAVQDTFKSSLAELRRVGGAKGELENFIPDPMTNIYAMSKARDAGTLLKTIKENADLARMRRPDGRPLPLNDEKELDRILMEAAETKLFGGDNEAVPSHGAGGMADRHRFFHWKDGQSWMNIHEAFGEGTAYDVMHEFLRNRAREIARVATLGRNPNATMEALIAEGKRMASEMGLNDLKEFNYVVERRLKPINDVLLGRAVPDPENRMLVGYGIVSNLARAALLKGASLISVPSDQATAIFFRHLNHIGGLTNAFDMVRYAKMLPGEADQWNRNMGYVADTLIDALHSHDRFSTFASQAPAWTQKTANAVLRANGMTAATEGARRTFREGLLISALDWVGKDFDKLPVSKVMERYGITAADWEKARGILTPYSPPSHPNVKTVNFTQLRDAGETDLYRKLQSFVIQESYNAVPDSNVEAHVILSGGAKPDTVVGALGNSFSMFKNMAVYIPMLMARQIIAREGSALTKATYVGTILAALTAVGAAKMQVQEVTMNGRTPRKMDAQFWTRATMVGGGFGVFGDAVFGAADSLKGRGINDIIAGAAASQVGSAANAVFGVGLIDAYKYGTGQITGEQFKADAGHKAVEFMRQNVPGTFYTYAVLNKQVFDKLDEMADPVGFYKRKRAQEQLARREKGNEPLQFK